MARYANSGQAQAAAMMGGMEAGYKDREVNRNRQDRLDQTKLDREDRLASEKTTGERWDKNYALNRGTHEKQDRNLDLDFEVKTLAVDMHRLGMAWQTSGDPQILSTAIEMTLPPGNKASVTKQGEQYFIQINEGKPSVYANSQDDYRSKGYDLFKNTEFEKKRLENRLFPKKPSVISPGNVVSQDGKQGVLNLGQEGDISFNAIPGGDVAVPTSGSRTTAANTKLDNETTRRRALGEIQQMGIPVTQELEGGYGGEYSQEQQNAMNQVFSKYGLTGYFAPVQTEDTGSGWTPFDNKMVTQYQLIDIVPNAGNTVGNSQGGLSRTGPLDQTGQQSQNINRFESDPEAVKIREQLRSGSITREEAIAMLQGKTNVAPPAPPNAAPVEKLKAAEAYSRGSYTNPPPGKPISEAVEQLGLGKENWKALAEDAALLGGFALDEFYLKPVNEIMRWLKKAYSKEGRAEARKSLQ